MFRGRTVAVVIPAYNERDKIAATIRSVPGYVDHILVVDDGSSDGTAAAARRHAGRRRGGVVEVLRHEVNRGVGAAIASGYARAVALGVQVTAVMAGDGQMDPADLPRLLEPVAAGRADYAKGNRFAWPGGWRRMPRARMVGNLLLSLATRVASGYWRLLDSQCGYTAASLPALLAIAPQKMFARYGYPNDLLARLGAAGARVVDVPVRPVYGPAWRSGLRPVRVALPIALLLARACWRRLWTRRGARALGALASAAEPLGDGT
ncbi:MAG TPA: glycosyltransferase family 2 protein [Polyangia bacterium]|jgi:glycosyltransferase involved in cell wall biosynthesis|nr:glycosyltransferase family 2 protein [Polyangia bacterium]